MKGKSVQSQTKKTQIVFGYVLVSSTLIAYLRYWWSLRFLYVGELLIALVIMAKEWSKEAWSDGTSHCRNRIDIL